MSSETTPAGDGRRLSPQVAHALIIGLGIFSPAAVFVALRIGVIRSCTGMNILGLPWHPVVSTAVLVLALLIVVGSFASLVYGYATRGLRSSAIAMTVWGLVSVVPVVMALFLSVYGDPGPDCIPV